jgi:hypothetical protein
MSFALLMFGWVSSPAQNRFAQIPVYGAGGGIQASTVADFHGDGRSDVLSVVGGSQFGGGGQLTLLTANASGGYGSPKVLYQLAANQTNFVVSGDFNGDGKQDFALASIPSDTIKVYLGNGNGTFQAPKVLHFSGSAVGLYAGKVDRDNRLDLVLVLNSGFTGTVVVLLGNGDGTFQGAKTTPFAYTSWGSGQLANFAMADVNLDGITDILAGDNYTINVLLGNGDGTFRIQKPIVIELSNITPITPYGIDSYFGLVVSDFDGDGKPDLLFADLSLTFPSQDIVNCGSVSFPSVFVLKGYGDGTFNPAGISYDAGNGGMALALGDWNGDGKTDLAVVNVVSSTISITAGTKSGFAASPWAKYAIASLPSDPVNMVNNLNTVKILGADVNGDGQQDLLLIDSSGVSVLLNHGGGNLRAPAAVDVSSYVLELQATDFNRDGFSDLAILGPDMAHSDRNCSIPGGGVFVATGSAQGVTMPRFLDYYDAGAGLYGYSQYLGPCGDGGENPNGCSSALSLGYFDGNGTVDIALNAAVLLNNGNAQFTVPGAPPGQLSISAHTGANYTTAAGDFNHDGISDLATVMEASNSYGESLQIRMGKGGGEFNPPVTYSLGGTDANAVLVKDVNGDGKLDVISVNHGTSTVSVFLGIGDGTFRAAREFAVTKSPVVVATGDFNGDGKPDLAVASNTSISILLGDGAGGFNRVHDFVVGGAIEGIAAIGLRGNGIADLVLVDGGLALASYNNLATGLGSVDGAYGGAYGALLVLYGKGDGTFAKPIYFGAGNSPTSLAIGDFNGDGAMDVAVASGAATAIPVFYNQGGTRIGLTSSTSTPKAGQPVTFTVTITASLPGNGSPTGTVTFKNGTTKIGTATLTSAKATLSYSLLNRGTHQITASYSGNTNFNPHVSGQITETVH